MNDKYYNDDELVYMIGENSEEALNILIKKYEPLIINLARQYVKTVPFYSVDIDDLVQEGRIAVLVALRKYNSKNNFLFYTFLAICIKRSFSNYIRPFLTKKAINQLCVYDYEEFPIADDSLELVDIVIDDDLVGMIIDFKNSLSFLEAQVFELRFNSFTYAEIGTLLDISVKRVSYMLSKVKKDLRKYLLNY